MSRQLAGQASAFLGGFFEAMREAGQAGSIVTILCDYGNRYQSKLYNPTFLKEKGLPVPAWLDRAPRAIPTVFEDA